MERRTLVVGFAALVSTAWMGEAQAAPIPLVGALWPLPKEAPGVPRLLEAFRQGLREVGYVEGKSISLEHRWAANYEALPGLASELVKLNVNAIVAGGTPAVHAAKQATSSIPIIGIVADPIGAGFVASLARPDANITGLSVLTYDLSAKRLQLLKEVLPKLSRVGILINPLNPAATLHVKELTAAAPALEIKVHFVEARGMSDLDRAFAAIVNDPPEALVVVEDAVFLQQRARIVQFAADHRIPAIYGFREFVDVGGLFSYAPSLAGMLRRVPYFVDKIIKGAKPGDLPVEQAATFEFVINIKSAKTLGLTIPPSLLARADQVIE